MICSHLPRSGLYLRSTSLSGAVMTLWLVACSGGDSSCAPTDPGCGPAVASITINSPVDSVAAVGSTVRLTAETRTASGGVASAQVTWSSSDPGIATVSSTGTLNALSPGTVIISAEAGGRVGTFAIRAVGADLQAVSLLLGDPTVDASLAAMSGTSAAEVTTGLTACDDAVLNAHVLAVEACLATGRQRTGRRRQR